jgi:hypothetical protein
MKDYNKEYQVNVPQGNLEEVAKLQKYADKIGYPYEGRQYGYNDMHGNTYIWSEWANYSILISDFHGGEIEFCYSDYNDGEELIKDEEEMHEAIGTITHEKLETYFNDWQMKKDLVAEYEAEEEMN